MPRIRSPAPPSSRPPPSGSTSSRPRFPPESADNESDPIRRVATGSSGPCPRVTPSPSIDVGGATHVQATRDSPGDRHHRGGLGQLPHGQELIPPLGHRPRGRDQAP